MDDLYAKSATELAAAVRGKALSAKEIALAHFDRIDKVNPSINAVVAEDRDATLAEAARIDAALSDGEDPGPMAGVPWSSKVNIDQAGFPTTNGLKLQKDLVAQVDSPIVANLRKAGGLSMGRTNTPAFSMRWFTKNDLHGQTLNPRNLGLTPGGSSGGAAAAVAAGLCAIGHGTDIAGSIRYPAYACGIHGLRPSFGRVPAYNATGADRLIGAQLMAVSGPLARTIEDIRLAFTAMTAPDVRDPWAVPVAEAGAPYETRVALSVELDGVHVSPEIKDALRAAAQALQDAGLTVDDVALPPMADAAEINAVLWMAEMQMSAKEVIRQEAESDSQFVFARMSDLAGPVDLKRVMDVLQTRLGLIRTWETFLAQYPLVLCPVSGELPFEQQTDVRSEEDFERIYMAQMSQRALPVLGLPSLAVATGSVGAPPMGVQLVSGRFREDILLDAGAVLEQSFGQPDVAMR